MQIRPINELALIFRAMNNDQEAINLVSIQDVKEYKHAEEFSKFLEINNLPIFESILNLTKMKPENKTWQQVGNDLGLDRSLAFNIAKKPQNYSKNIVLKVTNNFGIDEKSGIKIWVQAKINDAVAKINKKAKL